MSGPIPREVAPGVVWDAAAQARYLELVDEIRRAGLISGDAIEREARWAVESDLHRKFIKAQVMAGENCKTPEAKRRLFAEWVEKLGQARADEIAGCIRNERLREKILKEW